MSYPEKPWLKHYPRGIPHEVEVPQIPVTDLIEASIRSHGHKTALIYHGSKMSYEQLGTYIEKMASALYDLGVRKNSVAAIYLPNCPQFVISYYALQKLGAIPTAVSFLFSPREVRGQLEDSGAESIIMIDLLYQKIKPIIDELGIRRVILSDILHFMPSFTRTLSIILKKVPRANIPKKERPYFFEDLVKRKPVEYPPVSIDPGQDVASILYTSGTTGAAKGTSLTHYNIVASIAQVKAASGGAFDTSTHLLAYLPFSHMYGQNVIMTGGLSMGQTLVVITRPESKELLRYIEKYKISMLFGVPAFFRILIEPIKRGKYDLSSLKLCACGSDHTPQNLKDEWKQLTGADITEGYALTEATPATGIPVGGREKKGSVGIPLPGVMVAIADPDEDEFAKVGELGEILVSGPQVMKGYWNDGHRYPKAFAYIGGRKWLRTQDIGYVDNDGYFYMVERKTDVVKYKGYPIFPGEVETVISEHKAIKEVAVVGIGARFPEYGQIVKAFIVPRHDYVKSITKQDVIDWCRDKLAPYKIPKEVEFVEELPKDVFGKVVRRELRSREDQNR